ncbi:hypothetical protein ACIPYS_17735 [Kitasatospora sp. NPDC089913]|uniref:hypothetical protein n=1 Tax=Kitasatospora sp. NPDC089913 TaxID=3364080 RepID=UPI0037F52C4B
MNRPADLDQQLAELYERAGFRVEVEARGRRIQLRSLLDGPFDPNAPGLLMLRDGTAEVERDGRLVQVRPPLARKRPA